MSSDEPGQIITGKYLGSIAIVLAAGGAVAPGDIITVDSRGEDAHLLPLISVSGVREVTAKPKRVRKAAGSKS